MKQTVLAHAVIQGIQQRPSVKIRGTKHGLTEFLVLHGPQIGQLVHFSKMKTKSLVYGILIITNVHGPLNGILLRGPVVHGRHLLKIQKEYGNISLIL